MFDIQIGGLDKVELLPVANSIWATLDMAHLLTSYHNLFFSSLTSKKNKLMWAKLKLRWYHVSSFVQFLYTWQYLNGSSAPVHWTQAIPLLRSFRRIWTEKPEIIVEWSLTLATYFWYSATVLLSFNDSSQIIGGKSLWLLLHKILSSCLL